MLKILKSLKINTCIVNMYNILKCEIFSHLIWFYFLSAPHASKKNAKSRKWQKCLNLCFDKFSIFKLDYALFCLKPWLVLKL